MDNLFIKKNEYVDIIKMLITKNISIATAESITGGLIAKMITDVPGSSKILKESYVTYSNESKINILGVDKSLIDKYGVVSEEVARAMATQLKDLTKRDICIATTGNAGPTVCDDKPVGRVYVAITFCGEFNNYKNILKSFELNIDTLANDFNDEMLTYKNRENVRTETAYQVFNNILLFIKGKI